MSHAVFSYKNLSQLLWISKDEIKNLLICMNTCVVTLKDNTKIKVKAEELLPVINENRKLRAKQQFTDKSIIDSEFSSSYQIIGNSDKYYLIPHENHISCTCDDYLRLNNFYDHGQYLCKHGYALLNYLKIDSLQSPEYNDLAYELYEHQQYLDHLDRQAIGIY